MQLVGANPNPETRGVEELPGTSNYFIGNDSTKWRTNVPTYAKVAYTEAYPGIDLVYYGNPRQLEYDFVVAPGADPNAIRLAFDSQVGAQQAVSPRLDDNGDLVLSTDGAEVRLQKPRIYQEIDGVKHDIPGRYVLRDASSFDPQHLALNTQHLISVEVASYDRSKPLVIDPVLVYSTYLGGSGGESARGITVDTGGNIYVTGLTGSSNFPLQNPLQSAYGGSDLDVFVTKITADGSTLVFSTYLGGSGTDDGAGITVDASGNIYVAGDTISSNFPTTVGAFQTVFGGNGGGPLRSGDAFVAKLNATGSTLLYSTYLGGSANEFASRLAVDTAGNAYVTGPTASSNFPTTADAFQPTTGGGALDAFVAKLNATGSALLYSTYLGGSGNEINRSLALDTSGNVYVMGSTCSTNFPTSPSAFQQSFAGGSCGVGGGAGEGDIFISKLTTEGSALVYSTYLGGSNEEQGIGVAIDPAGNAYVTGLTGSPDFPIHNPVQAVHGGGTFDAFVAKLNADGSSLLYSTYLGGSGDDQGGGIAADPAGNAYVTGSTRSLNFPTTNPLQTSLAGSNDIFVTKLSPVGDLSFSTYLGGSENDYGYALAVDPCGDVYAAGETFSSNFPTVAPVQSGFVGGGGFYGDATVAKITFPDVVNLSLEKVDAPDPIIAGNQLTYTLTATNLCAKDATGVTVSDTLPPHVHFVSATPSQGSCQENGGVVTCTLETLPQHAGAQITVVGSVDAVATGTLTNQAAVSADQDDPDPRDNIATADTHVGKAIGVLANDSDPDGDPLTAKLVSNPTHGTLTLNPDGSFTYTPNTGFSGTDTFTYKANDGQLDSNVATVTITVQQGNHPPTITSTPTTTGAVGQPYSYDVDATDPDAGDVLTFSLSTAPAGMAINAATGLIQWTPSAAQAGNQAVTVRVQDAGGLFATQSFTITVQPVATNNPPTITSAPVTTAAVGQPYSYDVEATDPDAGDVLTFSLDVAPTGMNIDPAMGLIQWTPTTAQVGDNTVTVRVQDAGGLFATQSFTVTVTPAGSSHPPEITSTPSTARWIQLSPTGTPPTPRAYAGAMPYDVVNDRLILFSGENNFNALPRTPDVWVLTNASGTKEPPTWIQLSPTGTPPVGRVEHSVVYDPTSNRLIIHGGCQGNCLPILGDTWVLTNANGLGGDPEWIQLPSSNTRSGHVAGYDPVSNRMVVFGGHVTGFPGGDTNDVKVLIDANGIGDPTWISLAPTGTPPAPRGEVASGMYDPLSNRLVIFGGFTTTQQTFNDVWVLSNANGLGGTPEWAHLAPSGTPPALRGEHSVIYDPNSNRLTVFGGLTPDPGNPYFFFNDTWVLTHANGTGGPPEWIPLAPAGDLPVGRGFHSVGYAGASNRMVVALGRNDRAPSPGTFNDAWVLTNASGQCTAGQLCNYDVEATDPDAGDVLTFSLDAAPAGMSIDAATGLIEWIPTPAQIGDHNVVVRLRDAGGLFVTQSFPLTVAPVAVPNVVGLDPASAEALIGAADLVVGTLTNVGGEITLDFNSLPSAQGWQYKNSTATDLNPNVSTPEASVFSISQGVLHQDSFGLNTPAYYSQRDMIDARLPFSLSFRARVTEDLGDPTNNPYGFGFDLFAKQEIFQIGLSTGILAAFLNPRINFDNRTYHDYTLRGATGRGYRLSVDNVDVLTGKANSLQGSDRQSILLFGQLAGGRPNARADVQFLSFVQPRIIAQNPAPGTLVQNKSSVDLTVQDGPATATVPNIIGFTQAEAEAAILDADLQVGTITSANSDSVPAGQVISQAPVANTHVPPNTAVNFVLSLGPPSGNHSPTIISPPLTSATEGQLYSYDVDATDPDAGDTLAFSLSTAPAGMTIDPTTGLIQWTPTTAQVGDNPVTVRVTDSGSLFAEQSFTVTVAATPTNHPPIAVDDAYDTTQTGQILLDFEDGQLPSAKGWTYGPGCSPTFPEGVNLPEGQAASITNGLLHLDTTAPASTFVDAFYEKLDIVDLTRTQVFEARVRGLAVEPAPPPNPYVFQLTIIVDKTIYFLEVDEGEVKAGSATGAQGVVSAAVDASTFHTYSLVRPAEGTDYTVLVDGVPVLTGNALPTTLDVNQLWFGDGTCQSRNSSAEIDFVRFRQFEEGGALTIPAPGVLANDSDTDGDSLTAQVVNGPAHGAVTLNADGSFTYTPTSGFTGTDTFTYKANDGQADSNTATVTISVGLVNHPPQITSAPVTSATVGQLYSYDVQAIDPDGNPFTFSLPIAPVGMTIDPTTGLIQWTPTVAQVGDNSVTVRVTDSGGLFAEQSFTITVASQPTATVPNIVDLTQAAAEAAITAANLTVGSISTAPSPTVPAGNVISQTPVAGTTVSPGSAVSFVVSSGPPQPLCALSSILVQPVDPLILVGQTQPFTAIGICTDGTSQNLAGQVSWASSNATAAAIDGSGIASGLADGTTTISASLSGITGSTMLTVRATTPGDQTFPTAEITTPTDDSTITSPTDVIGTATDANFFKYVLDYTPVGQTTFTTLTTGTAPVTNGVLGTFDPTLLINDLYTLRLTVFDTANNTTETSVRVQVDREQKVGNFTLAFQDLSIPVSCLPITVTRTYDSRDKGNGDFGIGWRLDVKTLRLRESSRNEDGRDWHVDLIDKPGPFGVPIPTFVLVEDDLHKVSITLPDGKVEEFDLTPQPSESQVQDLVNTTAVYTPRPGTLGSLAVPADQQNLVVEGGELLYDDLSGVFDPPTFIYTAPDGTAFTIHRFNGVQQVQCTNGPTLTFGPNGITHSLGKGVAFTRDAQGRITTITDPKGNQHLYAYNANGDLVSVVDPEQNTTKFTYNFRHGLLDIIDPRGVRAIRNEYDDDGRLISNTDADGHTIQYTHDLVARTETVTDRLGHVTTYAYDDKGNVLTQTDALGHDTTFTYDAFGNEETRTDPLGRTTTRDYDLRRNVLFESDPLGHTTHYIYTALNAVKTITDPLNHVTTNNYDSKGNLLSTTDPSGETTSYTYDTGGVITQGTGNLLSTTDALNHTTSYDYDSTGNLTKETGPTTHVTTYEYDNNGNRTKQTTTRQTETGTETLITTYTYDKLNRLTQTTYPDGTTTQTIYNSIGKQSATSDQLGRQTTYAYDDLGRLVNTNYPDGTSESSTYDAEGRRLTSKDRAGRTTNYTYDVLGRLVQTAHPGGATETTTYDIAGQVIATTDAGGNVTQYEYDLAGRRTTVIDALTHETSFTYDEVGNQKTITDTNTHTTAYTYDNNNRRTQVSYPDGTSEQTTYDALGRTVKKTDQAGKVTQFTYDALGRLVTVTDAFGQNTTYTYDEAGNQLTQTDANNHTTSFAYDRLGRRVKRTLPLGQFETYEYNDAGNQISKTDFNGKTTTYGYDAANRLTSKAPDPSLNEAAVSFTYTPTGQRASMSDASGTTNYTYDNRDRLTEKATPQGTLTYTYDPAGNLLSIDSSHANGVSVDYAYDALNRLVQVTDNRLASGVTTYSYDDVGNLDSYLYPNGVEHQYTYNSLNRLTNLTVSKVTTLASYAYDLGPAGNRTAVTEQSGRKVSYAYDDLYRLTEEKIENAPASLNGTIGYEYDPVGNRKTRTSTVAGIPNQTFTYDTNDRLSSDTYDDNGNTTGSSSNTYDYDYENHLTEQNGGGVTIIYDGDGNRVSKTVGGVITQYLVDDRNHTGYAQVLEEIVNGVVQRQYTYGLDLISQNQPSGVSFYGYDGHGSVRLLADVNGVMTDTYDYEAFGTVIASTGGTPNVYLYAGEQNDPNVGFYYLRGRYYGQETGRFQTIDLWEGVKSNPQTLNKYSYASGNPVSLIDPSGNLSVSDAIVTSLINIYISSSLPAVKLPGTLVGKGQEAWRHYKYSWSPQDVEDFRRYIDVKHVEYVEQGRHRDCADLAMELLITYAIEHGLPVRLRNNRYGIMDSLAVPRTLRGARFLLEARNWTSSDMLYDYNTDDKGLVPNSVSSAKVGDLMIRRGGQWPHTRIFLEMYPGGAPPANYNPYGCLDPPSVNQAGGTQWVKYVEGWSQNSIPQDVRVCAKPRQSLGTMSLRWWKSWVLGALATP